MTTFAKPSDLLGAVGSDLGATAWMTIDQARIDLFAEATGDHQWIHVDPTRAADGPFGTTIAHGYLTLSLTNLFLPELLSVEHMSLAVNYGVDKIRFPAPVTVGSEIRGSAVLTAATEIPRGIQAVVTITVEINGGAKPACVVESITRFMD